MGTFNIKENQQMKLVCDRNDFEVNVSKHKLVIEGIGSVSSSGDYFRVDSHDIKHYCGYHGFGLGLNDVCLACDENKRRSNILHAAYKHAELLFGVI